MNGTEIFLDANICIYLLNGDTILAELLQDQNIYISIITEMELYACHSENQKAFFRRKSDIKDLKIRLAKF